jgi:predicted O-linked N-acetylglucosamine transferase (SPINDLY family)
VDVALDPFPYAGGATTADALWMGVPVITMIGDRYIGHQGESLLHAATLSDWIARDKEDYVRKAVTRAADIASLRELREQLRERVAASPLFDAPRFSRNLGSAWRGMWERWCNGA